MEIFRSKMTSGLAVDRLVVGCVQMAPIWLNRAATLAKVAQELKRAAAEGCQLIAFGEALVPGYPFWLEHTDGARFNNPKQKAIYARYVDEGVDITRGDLTPIAELAKQLGVSVYLGIMERAPDRGGHTLY
jgi:nitrilase